MTTYIKEYSELSGQEQRQLKYKRAFKNDYPLWDDSMILLTQLFDRYTNDGLNVLDAGCGNGNFVIDELTPFGKFSRKTGFDVSPDVTTKNTSMDLIVYGNLESLPFENASFDAVVALWVLEHLDNPGAVFSELKRVLKPKGIFAFVTPNKNSYLIILRRLMNKWLANKLVYKFYGRKEEDVFEVKYKANSLVDISKLANDIGFDIEFLQTNFDPSYTSFGKISYFVNKKLYEMGFGFFKPHIVAVLRSRN